MFIRRLRLPALMLAAAALFVTAAPSHAGPNLLPNPDFEQSAIEPGPTAGQMPQPLLPTGWAFEGLAGLFDHSPHGGSGGSARSAAISIPAGGKSSVCGPEVGCTTNPATGPKNNASLAYSVNPAWRNALPVSVNAGQIYTLRADLSWNLVTEGEGAFGQVRWLDANGAPMSVSTAFTVRATAATSVFRYWAPVSGTAKAPTGAKSAVVLLGATDDVFISQILFDKAFFG